VSLGLCTQIDLDSTVKKAADKKAKLEAKTQEETGESLKPVEKAVKETDTNQPKVEHTLESLFKPSKL
jgi:hypothetical protein